MWHQHRQRRILQILRPTSSPSNFACYDPVVSLHESIGAGIALACWCALLATRVTAHEPQLRPYLDYHTVYLLAENAIFCINRPPSQLPASYLQPDRPSMALLRTWRFYLYAALMTLVRVCADE